MGMPAEPGDHIAMSANLRCREYVDPAQALWCLGYHRPRQGIPLLLHGKQFGMRPLASSLDGNQNRKMSSGLIIIAAMCLRLARRCLQMVHPISHADRCGAGINGL